ncbi:MAG TPA: response regulator transcription factor [Acidimicrobiia bacterium]|nr:response regulator transcription factor [Acidimicrobiia bacterium]
MSAKPSEAPAPIRLVLVDDHELVRHGLRFVLEAQGGMEVVGEAATVAEGIRRIRFDSPDVAVVDLDLPDGSGIDVCQRVVSEIPETKVLILTGFADRESLQRARQVGAAGFLLKKVGDNQLADAIRKIVAGGSGFDDAPAGQPEEDPVVGRLTEREQTILELMTEGKTNREIAAQLFLAEKTVKNYVSNLLMKMGIKHRAGAAAYLARVRATEQVHFPPASWQQPSRR